MPDDRLPTRVALPERRFACPTHERYEAGCFDCVTIACDQLRAENARLREERVTALVAENARLRDERDRCSRDLTRMRIENTRLREGYVERLPDTTLGDWLSCRYCKAWAPEARFEHEKGCILDA